MNLIEFIVINLISFVIGGIIGLIGACIFSINKK